MKLQADSNAEMQQWIQMITKLKSQVPKEEEEDDPYRE